MYCHRIPSSIWENRKGDIAFKKLASKYKYTLEEISAQTLDEISVSSTKVRNALLMEI